MVRGQVPGAEYFNFGTSSIYLDQVNLDITDTYNVTRTG